MEARPAVTRVRYARVDYVGDGVDNRVIPLPFFPNRVLILTRDALASPADHMTIAEAWRDGPRWRMGLFNDPVIVFAVGAFPPPGSEPLCVEGGCDLGVVTGPWMGNFLGFEFRLEAWG